MTISTSAQKDGGATILEIGQQPEVWREVASRADEPAAEFLREVVGRPDIRIVLTGAGSSAFLGEIAAPALRRHLGRRVEAIATTSIVASPLDFLERHTPTLLVSFGRSGNSPESLATTALADELVDDVWHLDPHLRSRRPTGPRAQRSRELLRRLHAGTHQRQRLRHDVEPDLDAVDVPAAARACQTGRR